VPCKKYGVSFQACRLILSGIQIPDVLPGFSADRRHIAAAVEHRRDIRPRAESEFCVNGLLVRKLRHNVRLQAQGKGHIRQGDQLVYGIQVHPFDGRYGVDTSGHIEGHLLAAVSRDSYWVTGYAGVPPSVLWQAIDKLSLPVEQYTFVDVGCGKGRGLLLALKYPFRRVLGVELDPELAKIANSNLERFQAEWRKDIPVNAACESATRFEIPAGPLLLFLNNPFAAPVMRQFLDHLQVSLVRQPREVYLLYGCPDLDALLTSYSPTERLWNESLVMSEEDAEAEPHGRNYYQVAAYRIKGT
jgi:SAM-dependent methyltransferase